MSEIIRFRMVRSPRRNCKHDDQYIALYPGGALSEFATNVLNPGAISRSRIPATFLELNGLSERSTTLTSPLDVFDSWLLCQNNRPAPSELAKLLSNTTREQPWMASHVSPTVNDERSRLADLLLASMLTPCLPELRARLTRLLTIYGLAELFFAAPRKVNTRDEIYSALRWRTIVLPKELYDLFDLPEFRRARSIRSGFSDLYLAREEWLSYELGEISHIENVRAGELKERRLSRLAEREDIITNESETTTFTERSSESTDRFELSEEVMRDTQMALGVEATVETSGQYGPTQVDTHIGGSFDFSQQESSTKASSQIKESVTRAVTRIEQRVREQRVARSLVRTESSDLHSLKNESANDRVSVYRWVYKIKRVQIFRYPNRYLLEFQIPEPGAWWRWLLAQPQSQMPLSPKPLPFTQTGNEPTSATDRLTYDQITVQNYQAIGARYLALGLTPPPEAKTLSAQVSSTSDMGGNNDVVYVVDQSLTVPDGYRATTWQAGVMWSARANQGPGSVTFAVGVAPPTPPAIPASSGGYAGGAVAQPVFLRGNVGDINMGTIPIVASGYLTDSYTVNLTVHCDPNDTGMLRWKISTYEKIAAAYADMQRQYDEERRSIDDSIPSIADRFAPGRNQEIIRDELKKHVISMLIGVDFNGRPVLELDANAQNQPHIDVDAAERLGPEIQFIEQAFEWGNLSYVLYPYLWAGRDRWPDIALIDGADPDFARFLRSGSARVVIPARPGFESAVQLYARFGVLWGGGPVPAPEDSDYLSIAEEIKSMQRAPDDGEAGESWEVTLPTSLVCLGDGSGLPMNASITLDAPPGQVLP